MKNIKRIRLEIFISFVIIVLFMSGAEDMIPPALQLFTLKIVLVSTGLLHAHAAGKLLINTTVNWTSTQITAAHYVRMVLYAIIPVCYAFGG